MENDCTLYFKIKTGTVAFLSHIPYIIVPVKLIAGGDSGEGMLMIYSDLSRSWSAVCADGWNRLTADVACRSMGYHDGAYHGMSCT